MTDIVKVNTEIQASPSRDVDALLSQFLIEAQIMENSRNRYRKSLKIYFNWVRESGLLLADITLTELLKYKDFLMNKTTDNGTKLSQMTVGAYLVAVKAFYNWAEGKNYIQRNPSRQLKSPKKESKFKRQPLPLDKCIAMLEYLKPKSKRDFAIVNLMARIGLRTFEVTGLNYEDIQLRDGIRVIYVQGKGKVSKDKWVKLLDAAYLPIHEYILTRKDVLPSSPLFVSDGRVVKGGRMIPGTISEMVKDTLRAIGVDSKHYTAHSLRHTAGTEAMRSGATLEQIKDMHRHSSSNVTAGYVVMAQEEKHLKEKSAENYVDDAFAKEYEKTKDKTK